MVKPRFESITVTGTGPAKLVLFPASGNPRKVFIDMLLPKLDLLAAWTRGASGWTEIINDHAQNPVRAQRIMNFVSGKLGIEWQASNTSNGYKPLRDAIGRLTGFNASLKEPHASAGKSILYRAMLQADRKDADKIPDFLYNHLRPPAFVE